MSTSSQRQSLSLSPFSPLEVRSSVVEIFKYLWQKEYLIAEKSCSPEELAQITASLQETYQNLNEQSNQAFLFYQQRGPSPVMAQSTPAQMMNRDPESQPVPMFAPQSKSHFDAVKHADMENETLPEDIANRFRYNSANQSSFFNPYSSMPMQPRMMVGSGSHFGANYDQYGNYIGARNPRRRHHRKRFGPMGMGGHMEMGGRMEPSPSLGQMGPHTSGLFGFTQFGSGGLFNSQNESQGPYGSFRPF